MQIYNRKVLRAPGPRTKYFKRIFCRSVNYIKTNFKVILAFFKLEFMISVYIQNYINKNFSSLNLYKKVLNDA